MYKKILVPTDGSIHSNNAARHAIGIACKMNADITALNVIDNHYLELTTQYGAINRLESSFVDNAKDSLNRIQGILTEARIKGKCNNEIQIETKIREGNPAGEILRMIKEEGIDLIVMGRSGKKGVKRFLMGSTASKVVRSARCPVLTVI
ncbi:universal stress protein [Methanobacterium sp. ACI-7]|uniref:universal stress protein n=1 Tax=unclassified Methanobacterium TaxID=2627676 RepID=UPI0039C0751F